MTEATRTRTGGQALVDALRIHGVDTVFCVPGESYLAVLDALHDAGNAIRTIACRQEGGASFMAEAYGKVTGKPGVLMVTRGPGACNASIGVHTAQQDSTPMVVLIGQVARDQEYREAFQEVDYRRFYGPLCKWVAQIESADRVPELVSQAFHRACSGRPGPVALALPEDMLRDLTAAPDAGPVRPAIGGVDAGALAELGERIARAERPFLIAGGGGWTAAAVADLQAFASAHQVPVGASFRCQDRFDNTHACYAGDVGIGISPKLAARIRESDLLIVAGARLGEMTTQGYTLVDLPVPRQDLVHIHPDPEELGSVYQSVLPISATMPALCAALAGLAPGGADSRRAWVAGANADYLEHLAPTPGLPGTVDMGAVMAHIQKRLPPEAILTTDAGNFSGWMHRHYQYRRYPTQLGPTNGAMGYGFPSAIAARLVHPDRPVVAFCGDGGALMSGQEIATAMLHGIDPVFLVINNNMYGTIRMHQERDYPDRQSATALRNPDFARWAESFGAHGELVTETAQFAPALERALGAGKAAVIEIRIDPELINTKTTLSKIRGTGKKR
ncbi:MAG: thiamine pyrophosphate-binding protein [Ectothiorhodospiraceae bacterium]|nr:thiamine pyrophosphate-binding protein [Ectothiorhodospiraceae bacterium]